VTPRSRFVGAVHRLSGPTSCQSTDHAGARHLHARWMRPIRLSVDVTTGDVEHGAAIVSDRQLWLTITEIEMDTPGRQTCARWYTAFTI
jgi:hypothetical protein